jgi:hypothetical protein
MTGSWRDFLAFMVAPLALSAALHAQTLTAPEVPDELKAGPEEHLVLLAHASGAQVYTCTKGESGASQWVLKGPDATLRDDGGDAVGQHSVGPKWTYRDGSSVTGKAVAHLDALDPNAVAWLKLQATGHAGTGLLTRVTTVQRIHTHGGQAPAATKCTPAEQNKEVRVPYTADYYFYAPSEEAAH